jgi:hypothetical protein
MNESSPAARDTIEGLDVRLREILEAKANLMMRPGDIVSTDKGLMLFRGRSAADGQTADLVPLHPR